MAIEFYFEKMVKEWAQKISTKDALPFPLSPEMKTHRFGFDV